jgi:hypothetical protein
MKDKNYKLFKQVTGAGDRCRWVKDDLATEDTENTEKVYTFNKKFLQMFHGVQGPHGMGDLLELALLSFKFYPRPYALGPRLNLFKRSPLARSS